MLASNRNIPLWGLVLLFSVGTGAAVAQDSRYSSDWRNSDTGQASPTLAATEDSTQKLVDELKALVDSATDANAADPQFLQDLRDLALRYAWPWRTRLLTEDFSDGDYTRNPEWTVVSGSFAVEAEGLRLSSVAATTVEPTAETSKQEAPSTEELAISILSGILSGGSRESQKTEPSKPETATAEAAPDTAGQILLPAAIPNAFAVRAEISSTSSGGSLELGVAQGERNLGYRLAYAPGGNIELLRYGSRGVAVIDASTAAVTLEDGARHLLQLTRSAAGEIVISVDGAEMIRVVDKAFRDTFEDLVVLNQGGDYMLHGVTIFGS